MLGSLLLAALALILKRERATEHLSFKRKDVLMEHCIKILQRCSTLLIISAPEDLPNPVIEPGSPAWQADSLPSEPPEKPIMKGYLHSSITTSI